MQRHPARTNGQVWIDTQPRPGPESGTPVKVLTVFKTCPDAEETPEAGKELAIRQPHPSPSGNRATVKQQQQQQQQRRTKSAKEVDTLPEETDNALPAPKPVSIPASAPIPANIIHPPEEIKKTNTDQIWV